eukprot:8137023-Pyramimonas_sp.AAC.1
MSLDIPERQILVHYPDDGIPHHHRILLVKLDGSRWIWSTPDFSVRAIDVADRAVVPGLLPLARNAPFPQGLN